MYRPQVGFSSRKLLNWLLTAALLGLVGTPYASSGAQDAGYYFSIGYELPKDPNLAPDARAKEGEFLGDRAVRIRNCFADVNCEREAEIGFRKQLSGIPGVTFWLAVKKCPARGCGQNVVQLIPLTPDDAVDPRIDLNIAQLPQAGWYEGTGLYLPTSAGCAFRRTSDNSEVHFPEEHEVCEAVADNNGLCDVLWNAIDRGHGDLVNFFLSQVTHINANINDVTTCNPLGAAGKKRQWVLVKRLVEEYHAKIDVIIDHSTPFHDCPYRNCAAAAAMTSDKFMLPVETDDVNLVKFLLDHGAKAGYGSLSVAVSRDRRDMAQLLLQSGAKADGALVTLAALKNDTDMVKLLVTSGADVRINPDYCDECFASNGPANNSPELYATPLSAAAAQGNIPMADFFLQLGADPNAGISSPGEHLDGLYGEFGGYRGTALLVAALKGRIGMVKFLLDHGAWADYYDPRTETTIGLTIYWSGWVGFGDCGSDTPLVAAAGAGYPNIVQMLLSRGGHYCRTALDRAAANGHLETARFLLGHVAWPLDVDNIESALTLAEGNHYEDTVAFLTTALLEKFRTLFPSRVRALVYVCGGPLGTGTECDIDKTNAVKPGSPWGVIFTTQPPIARYSAQDTQAVITIGPLHCLQQPPVAAYSCDMVLVWNPQKQSPKYCQLDIYGYEKAGTRYEDIHCPLHVLYATH